MKKFFFAMAFFLSTNVILAQTNKEDIANFVRTFEIHFSAPYMDNHYKSLFTASFLIVDFNSKHAIDSIYFSDTAPVWQVEELNKIKKRLNMNALINYAKRNNFTGKLIFPTIIKSVVTKGAVDELDFSAIYDHICKHKNKFLSGNIQFEKTIVVVAPAVIRYKKE